MVMVRQKGWARWVWAVAVALALRAGAEPFALDSLLQEEAAWAGREAFLAHVQKGRFAFVSGREVVRSADPGLTFLGGRVWEAQGRFDAAGGVVRVELSLYNRGDAGDLAKADFDGRVAALHERLGAWSGTAGVAGAAPVAHAGAATRRRVWTRPPCAAALDWGFVAERRVSGTAAPFRADFIRVTLMPVAKGADAPAAAQTDAAWAPGAGAVGIRSRVRRTDAGDLVVGGVPMVDQGQKGYCAAATSERLLRYYGRSVDQHEIAMLANTAATNGTSIFGMAEALKTVGAKFSLDFRELVGLDVRDLEKLVRDYNKAKPAAMKAASLDDRMIDVGALYAAFDAATLRQVRARRNLEKAAFLKQVETHVAAGVPLIWACMVGLYDERPALNATGVFGHMRLITGLNRKTNEILYSDTWGTGHEEKRLPVDDVWAMTVGLFALRPRNAL